MQVSIKFANRLMERVYNVDGDFEVVKATVKASGARYDGTRKRWKLTSKAALDELKAKFAVTPGDIVIGDSSLRLAADDTIIYAPKLKTRAYTPVHDPARLYDILREKCDLLQAAYLKGDEAFGDAYEALREQGDEIFVD